MLLFSFFFNENLKKKKVNLYKMTFKCFLLVFVLNKKNFHFEARDLLEAIVNLRDLFKVQTNVDKFLDMVKELSHIC